MRKSIKYGSIERVTYEFSRFEVQQALMKDVGLYPVPSGVSAVFETDEDDGATLTLVYEKEAPDGR